MKKLFYLTIALLFLSIFASAVYFFLTNKKQAANFTECVNLSGQVQESYPRKCLVNGQTFTEDIGNELEKWDIIQIEHPRPNIIVTSPLEVVGTARGIWFFEASFPVTLEDEQGNIIAQGIAQAIGEWMTEEFVPFNATLSFTEVTVEKGKLVLHKDNPSGLPENDDSLVVPVRFK